MNATTPQTTPPPQTAERYIELRNEAVALVKYLRDRLPESERRTRLVGKALDRYKRRKWSQVSL